MPGRPFRPERRDDMSGVVVLAVSSSAPPRGTSDHNDGFVNAGRA
jgi:hypothetical protein